MSHLLRKKSSHCCFLRQRAIFGGILEKSWGRITVDYEAGTRIFPLQYRHILSPGILTGIHSSKPQSHPHLPFPLPHHFPSPQRQSLLVTCRGVGPTHLLVLCTALSLSPLWLRSLGDQTQGCCPVSPPLDFLVTTDTSN